jgi:hypothetical protein
MRPSDFFGASIAVGEPGVGEGVCASAAVAMINAALALRTMQDSDVARAMFSSLLVGVPKSLGLPTPIIQPDKFYSGSQSACAAAQCSVPNNGRAVYIEAMRRKILALFSLAVVPYILRGSNRAWFARFRINRNACIASPQLILARKGFQCRFQPRIGEQFGLVAKVRRLLQIRLCVGRIRISVHAVITRYHPGWFPARG